MAGLLTSLLGAAKGDPMGPLLGQYYDPNAERARRFSGLLTGMSEALLNPSQQGGGDFATIGRAINAGRTQAQEGGSGYLKEAMSRKIAADEMRRKQAEEDRLAQEDMALADFIAANPKYADFAKAYPKEFGEFWKKKMLSEIGGDETGAKYGAGNLVELGPDENGVMQYGYAQPSYQGGEPIVQPIKGAKPAWAPEVAGAKKAAETLGSETSKATVEQNVEDLSFVKSYDMYNNSLDNVAQGAEKYSGLKGQTTWATDPQGRIDWGQDLLSVKAQALEMAMGKTSSLYPMSEADRDILSALGSGGLSPLQSPERFKRAIKVMKDARAARMSRIRAGKNTSIKGVTEDTRSDEDILNAY